MTHSMKLREAPFNLIWSGKKQYEFRLFDEKRRLISVGDNITFTCGERQLTVRVKDIITAPSWKELEKKIDTSKTGDSNSLDLIMSEYYPREEEKKYGCTAICIELSDGCI